MAYSDVILASSPTAYWKMDDQIGTVMVDSSGNGNNGTYVGGIDPDDGPFKVQPNRSMTFPGSTAVYAQVLNSAAVNPGAGEYSIEFWFRTSQTGITIPWAKYNSVAPNYDGPTFLANYNTSHQNIPGVFQYRERDNVAFEVQASITGLNDGRWHYYVLQRRKTSTAPDVYALEFYVDGVIRGTTTLSTVIDFTPYTGAIYTSCSYGANPSACSISQVAYYVGKALSASDILAHYNANDQTIPPSTLEANMGGTVYTVAPKIGTGYGLQKSLKDPAPLLYKIIDSNYQNFSLGITDPANLIQGFISGTTVFQGAPLPFCKVNLYDRRTGVLIRSGISDINGKFLFRDLIPLPNIYYIVGVDPDGLPLYNSIIYDHSSPVPYSISLGGQFVVNTATGELDGGATVDSGVAPFTPELIEGSLPPGMTLAMSPDERTVIAQGTSTFYTDYYFTVQVSNGQGYVAQKAYQALLPTSFGKSNVGIGEYFNVIFAFDTDILFNDVGSVMSMDTLSDPVNPTIVWTATGSTAIQTTIKKFGTGSLYCPSDNNNTLGGISTPYNPNLDLSNVNDWTVECWVYVVDPHVSGNSRVLFTTQYSNNNIPVAVGFGNEGFTSNNSGVPWVGFYNYPTAWTKVFGRTPLPLTTWTHLAFTKKGNIYSIFMNGVLSGRGTITTAVGTSDTTKSFIIGRRWDNSSGLFPYVFGGYIDDFRITKGSCRYDTNFNVPLLSNPRAAPLDRDLYWESYGTQLTFEGGNVVDDTGNIVWNLAGSTVVDNAIAYSGNYSLLFDGNNSGYLSMPANLVPMQNPGDPFTIDLYFITDGSVSSTANGYCLFAQTTNSGSGEQGVLIMPSGLIGFYRSAAFSSPYTVLSGTDVIVPNQWHHYALVFDGSSMAQYLDGVAIGSTPTTTGWTITAENFKIGNCLVPSYASYQRPFKGSIDNFRITRGIARWRNAFTPPTFLPIGFDPDDTNHHIERMLAQPLKNLSTNAWNWVSTRLGSPTLSWNASGTNPYFQMVSPAGTTCFISFDKWGTFTGNYWFEIELDLAADASSRKHFGLYLDSGSTGQNGYRLSHLDNNFIISKWVSGTETVLFNLIVPDSMYPVTVGNRYTMRLEVVGNTLTYFFNGMFAGTFTDTTFTGLRPGLHAYGSTLNVRRIETGTLALPVNQTITTPPLSYNVALGRRSWVTDQTRGTADLSNNPSGYVTITDGNTASTPYMTISTPTIPASIIVDLESPQMINRVVVWHYYTDGRTYANTKTEVSLDGLSWTTIFDSGVSGTYAEPTSGTGHVINFSNTAVRYIKDTCGSSSLNANAHWVEIQASLN